LSKSAAEIVSGIILVLLVGLWYFLQSVKLIKAPFTWGEAAQFASQVIQLVVCLIAFGVVVNGAELRFSDQAYSTYSLTGDSNVRDKNERAHARTVKELILDVADDDMVSGSILMCVGLVLGWALKKWRPQHLQTYWTSLHSARISNFVGAFVVLFVLGGFILFVSGVALKAEEDESPRHVSRPHDDGASKSAVHHQLDRADSLMISGSVIMVIDLVIFGVRSSARFAARPRKWKESVALSTLFAVGATVFIVGVGMKVVYHAPNHAPNHHDTPHVALFHATMPYLEEGIAALCYGFPLTLAGILVLVVVFYQRKELKRSPQSALLACLLGFIGILAGVGLVGRGGSALSTTELQEKEGTFSPHEIIGEETAIGMMFGGVLCLLMGVLCSLPTWLFMVNLSHRYRRLERGSESPSLAEQSLPEDAEHGSHGSKEDAPVCHESVVEIEPKSDKPNVQRTSSLQDAHASHKLQGEDGLIHLLSFSKPLDEHFKDKRATLLFLFLFWLLLAVVFIGSGGTLIGVSLPALRSGQRTEHHRHFRPPVHHQRDENYSSMRPCDAMLLSGSILVLVSFIMGYLSHKLRYGHKSATVGWWGKISQLFFFRGLNNDTGAGRNQATGGYRSSAGWWFAVDGVMILLRGIGVGLIVAGAAIRSGHGLLSSSSVHHTHEHDHGHRSGETHENPTVAVEVVLSIGVGLCYMFLAIFYRWRVELGESEKQCRPPHPVVCVYVHAVGSLTLMCGVVLVIIAVSGALGTSPESLVFGICVEARDLMVAIGAVLFALTSIIALVGVFAYQKYVHNTVSAFIIADRLLSPLKMDDEPDFSHSDMEDKVRDTEFERVTHKIKRVLFARGFQRHLLVYGLLLMNCLGMQLLLFGTMPWRGKAGGTDNDVTDQTGITYWSTTRTVTICQRSRETSI
jgi:hypothetical protein